MKACYNKEKHKALRDFSNPGELYRILFEEATDGKFITDRHGRYVAVNPRLTELTGYSLEEFLGMNMTDLIPPEDLARNPICMDELRTGKIVTSERRILHKSGGLLPVAVNARMLLEGNILGIVRDITKRKRIEAQQSARLKRINRQQSALIEMSTNEFITQGAFEKAGSFIVETGARIIGVERTSIWLFNDKRTKIHCIELYEKASGTHQRGIVLKTRNYPRYFSALSVERVIDAHNALDEERTRELKNDYMIPLGITSKLDATIRLRGRVIGVICFEHVGDPRAWHEDEIAFAVSCADHVAVTLTNKERLQVEQELRESERKVRAIIDLSFGFLGLLTSEGSVVKINRSALEFVGVQMSDVVGKPFWETPWWNHSTEMQERLRNAVRIAAGGDLVRFEATHFAADGTLHTIDVSLKPVKDEAGRVVLLIPEGRDITERKKSEEALRQSECRFRSIIQESSDLILVLDESGKVTYESPSTAQVLGYEPGHLLGHSPLILVHPEDAARIGQDLQEVFDRVNPGKPSPFRCRRADGSMIYIEAVGSNQFRNPAVGGIVLTARDITERTQAEETLKRSEERMRLFFERQLVGMAIISPEKGWLQVNDKLCRMLSYSPEELSRLTWAELTHPDDLVANVAQFDRVLSGEIDEYSLEKRFIRKDGTIIFTNLSVGCVRHRDGSVDYVLSLLEDITERKRAEEEKALLQAQLMQVQKMESVGRLAGGVAHDFNNMLSAIIGLAELAMMRCAPSEPIHTDLKVIWDSAHRAADLTRQLLTFARKQTVSPKILDINDTVAVMLKILRRLIGEDIDLMWIPGAGLWPVWIDPSQIDQIFANLCVNARDAIAGVGKVTIETENAIFDAAYCAVHPGFTCGEYVMLAVSDDGCGMNKEVLDFLFEPFFTTKELGKGTGLGLATVYGIVKQNEGFINVYSEPDKGTTFKIYLPRFVGRAMEPTVQSPVKMPKGCGETVLLVEDEPVILEVSRNMLESLGYTVLTASRPSEALRKAEIHADEIQLLLTDVVMPEMNGRDLAILISHIKPGLKCLFTSGYTSNVIAHRGVLDQGVHFLQKPLSMNDLACKVRQALERE
ncbi:MAG: PAS domain S-box protein [Deltaproteobacteria bacterium]|nr:PAS domain S-box protein [Deltaproteobacteria bacterium]